MGQPSLEVAFHPCEQLLKFFNDYIYRIWPWAMIAIAVAITAAWIFLLAFGFVKLIEMAI